MDAVDIQKYGASISLSDASSPNNPFKLICQANFDQSSSYLPNEARGRQCVANSYMYLLAVNKEENLNLLQSEFLHDIMFSGSYLYCAMKDLGHTEDYIDPAELPCSIVYKQSRINIVHKSLFSGFLFTTEAVDGNMCHSLETALSLASESNSFILVFQSVAIGIHLRNRQFYVFDSHSRNEQGYSCINGTCVLGFSNSLSDLCSYVRSLYLSFCTEFTNDVQFDLHVFKFLKRMPRPPYDIHIFEKRLGFDIKFKNKGVKRKFHDSFSSTTSGFVLNNQTYANTNSSQETEIIDITEASLTSDNCSVSMKATESTSCNEIEGNHHDTFTAVNQSKLINRCSSTETLKPVPFKLICQANFDQSSTCLPHEARGRQCVANSYMYLLAVNKEENLNLLQSEFLHDILFSGSYLYCAMKDLGHTEDYIDPAELPCSIVYKQSKINIAHKSLFSGFLFTTEAVDDHIYYSLERAFSLTFIKSCNCILVFHGVAIGIHLNEKTFYIFDSHSRNEIGVSCSNGTSVLGYVNSFIDLCSYIRLLCLSIAPKSAGNVQFDLHSYQFKKKMPNIANKIHILDDRLGFNIISNKWTATKRLKRSTEIEINNQNIRQHIESASLSNELDIDGGYKNEPILSNQDTSISKVSRNILDSGLKSLTTENEDTNRLVCNQSVDNCLSALQQNTSQQTECYATNNTNLVSKFGQLVSVGPNYVCTCCHQTFFHHYMKLVTSLKEKKEDKNKYLSNYLSVNNKEWLCTLCFSAIKSGSIPKFWVNNGLKFPVKPIELDLTNLEERLVSPRLPFMQLREMPRGGQINLKGNIVNVPADVSGTIKSLPRMIDDSQTVMLKLKRKLSYKHHVAFENIRPNKVFQAAKWLVCNSSLFKSEGIVLNDTWLQQAVLIDQDNNSNTVNNQDETDEDLSEDEIFNERPTGNLDTLLHPADFREFNQVFSVAPAEHNTPLGLFQDLHSEVFSFPTIYCGQKRIDNSERFVPLHYSDICKWELRTIDRRVALCVSNIFYKLKRLQIKQIKDKVSLAIRKCKANGQKFTAGEISSPGFVEKLSMQNDGYRVLRTMRGSPPYWEQAKRDIFAMIRQLGIPTWFCSFSAAETKWIPLLKSLSLLVNGVHMTEAEIEQMSWQEKCYLIKSDPVTCARYFDYRVQTFIKEVLKDKSFPIGEIIDFFYRVEFQQRGSPHIHMLIWIKDAPVYRRSKDDTVTSFVDQYVSCAKDSSMPVFINYQTHRHARTCKKNNKTECRFNFPIPPMPNSVILDPLENDNEVSTYNDTYENIMTILSELNKKSENISFPEFLAEIGISYESYILTIRSKLLRSKLFLKRSVAECRINNYNTLLLNCWQANMDIQFVLDPYACVSYIVSYISKGQRGLSNLLHAACEEAMETESDIRQQVRKIGNQFLSSVEIGAQEAAYLVLQIPLRRCTRCVAYVDTNKSETRTSLLKPLSEIKDLPKNSTNIEMDNILKRYQRRPKCLERLCYADFASWYELCPKQKETQKSIASEIQEELPETEYVFDEADDIEMEKKEDRNANKVKLFCGTVIRKRLHQKVIYTHSTSINKDKEEYFRQKLMLFSNWRNEDNDLIAGYQSYEESYDAKKHEISSNEMAYNKVSNEVYEQMFESFENDRVSNDVYPEGQHQEEIDEMLSKENDFFDPDSLPQEYDIGQDLGIARKQPYDEVLLPQKELDTESYLYLVQNLNNEQKAFFYHILHKVKNECLPFHTFLTGGAGVGKTVVIKAIYQALLKFLNHKYTVNPDQQKLLLCAPTGKAAHNISGKTIHSAFHIPANQGFKYKPLDSRQLDQVRAHYSSLEIVIIDEISMVGRSMFNFINLRLQEIMGCTKPFGNVSILAVGDLFQLKPVMDAWIFSQVFYSPQIHSLALNLWVEMFDFYELTRIMRQRDDVAFAELLNRLREGKQTNADKDILNSRQIESLPLSRENLATIPHLYTTRHDVATHNNSVLENSCDQTLINIQAVDDISGDLDSSLKTNILTKVPEDHNKTMGLQTVLRLGIGLPCELCLNVDTEDGLTNGASGMIMKFDFRVKSSDRCSIVWVLFDNLSSGKRWRIKYRHLFCEGIPPEWTPIFEVCRKFSLQYFRTYLIIRRQFPLYLSSGKTIHKAQGSTMKNAVLHFGSRKIDHIHYVGLSRMTSLSGIYIKHLNYNKISVSSDVLCEMQRLRDEKKLLLSVPRICNLASNISTISFQNCRSLQKHFTSFQQEYNLLNSCIIGLSETRCFQSNQNRYDIEGFNVHHSTLTECCHGLAVYIKDSLSLKHICFNTINKIEFALLIFQEIIVCFVYCPPKQCTSANISTFLAMFESSELMMGCLNSNLVLMGDFNSDKSIIEINTSCTRSQMFHTSMKIKRLLTGFTTDYGSTLDHIYTNLSDDKIKSWGTLESFYSDHKPVFLSHILTSDG